MDDEDTAVILQAERIIYRASWQLLEETALESLAGTRGLRRARLEPRSEVIQLVTYDGEHLGHIRRDRAGPDPIWVAVPRHSGRTAGPYHTPQEAAQALTRTRRNPGSRFPGHDDT